MSDYEVVVSLLVFLIALVLLSLAHDFVTRGRIVGRDGASLGPTVYPVPGGNPAVTETDAPSGLAEMAPQDVDGGSPGRDTNQFGMRVNTGPGSPQGGPGPFEAK